MVPLIQGTIDSKIYQYRAGRASRFGACQSSVVTFVKESNVSSLKLALKYVFNLDCTELDFWSPCFH